MKVAHNPTAEKIAQLCADSEHKAAKWICDKATGDYWYWPAEDSTHANMAVGLCVTEYDKGIAIPNEEDR